MRHAAPHFMGIKVVVCASRINCSFNLYFFYGYRPTKSKVLHLMKLFYCCGLK